MARIKALLVGCGNIGALYDLGDDTRIHTHAKAFSNHPKIDFSVTDADAAKAKKVANHYNVASLPIDDIDWKAFDIVSITTPTSTHADYLSKLLKANVPVVICEKPVAAKASELSLLKKLHAKSDTKVLVNYIRRFQPAYAVLKARLQRMLQAETLRGINVTYRRGFLNNATHAADLLQYLFDEEFSFTRFNVQSHTFDAFDDDPTLTGSCLYRQAPVTFVGLADVSYNVFSIDIFFDNSKIVIANSGYDVHYYKAVNGALVMRENLSQEKILQTYMQPVVHRAVRLLARPDEDDNFIAALTLAERAAAVVRRLK